MLETVKEMNTLIELLTMNDCEELIESTIGTTVDIVLLPTEEQREEHFERFPIFVNINENITFWNDYFDEPVDFSAYDELEVFSCRYFGSENRLNTIKDALSQIFIREGGIHEVFEDVPGFAINFEITTSDLKEVVYFVGTGNNGQELVTGLQGIDAVSIEDENIINTVKFLDCLIFKLAIELGLEEY